MKSNHLVRPFPTGILLASASPRRQEILRLAGINFQVVPANIDERVNPALSPSSQALFLARKKALVISDRYPGKAVLAADTIVALGEKSLGKPGNDEEAFAMLTSLSGKTHSVFTGVALFGGDEEINFVQKTSVSFYELTDEEIGAYIATGEPFDKAGAYGIQGRGGLLVEKIDGDYWNVVGLPIARLLREVKKRGSVILVS
ncbi:MAG: Maf family protein [Oscillospiraceae bacterium]|nr:Maf family protein [Oscillospiraceae bacterium]